MTTKKQKRDKTRATRLAQRERLLEKQKQDEELDELQEETPEVEELAEVTEKAMDEYYMGPTSWDEMDAMKTAREQAEHVREATWNTQDLVYNILGHPMMAPKEKAEAMKKVADGFGERVSGMMAEHEKMMKKDMDILVIESILAHDKRNSKPLEFIGDFISKAKLTASAENNLSDDDFALVMGDGDKKVRKYPIHDKAHVRNALARAAQMMGEGGEAATDAKKAMPKIRAAAKKMGIEMSMEKDRNAIVIEKDANGDWRWIGWVSNNFVDWDGDIISEDSHKEYVEWLEKNLDLAPVSTTWHEPALARKSAVDFATYENGFLIMSGKLTEDEAEGLLKARALTDLGMSHGTFVLARDPKDKRVITKYRMYECSDLPLENAANPFTDFEILAKEADMDKTKYLAAFFGGDETKADAFLEKTGLKQKALQDAGIENKEKTEPAPAPVVSETQAEPPAPPTVPDTQAILEALKKELGMDELSQTIAMLLENVEKVPVLEALVKELQGDQEEKLAELLTPPASRFSWMQKARASQSDENVLDEAEEEDKKLKKAQPELGWLSEATGTTPVAIQ